MNFIWQIQPEDIEKVRLLVDSHLEDRLVKERIAKNLGSTMPTIGKEEFWHSMVSCLTTTVARAGPNSAVAKFAEMEPFPLAYSTCLPHLRNLAAFAQPVLRDKGRLRRNGRIAEELAVNLASLESGGWDEVFKRLASMWEQRTAAVEQEAANFIDTFKGFGPKQSRNLLQDLGFARYEVPIDSRVTKWFNKVFKFPITLSANALADSNYYEFVLDAVQQLCRQADVMPCVLDAAIFSSFDGPK